MHKPRLLRETAEIALTEIKRYIEPKFTEDFSLRRVSAPLYLPVDSGLNMPGETLRFKLPHNGAEMEIVRGLDRWLRQQLVRYDIAPGFGVFTVMTALQPEVEETSTSSPHVGAWSWQQTIAPENVNTDYLVATAKRIYTLLKGCEEMILGRFPHLAATLPARLMPVESDEIARLYPQADAGRAQYLYLRDSSARAALIIDGLSAEIHVWNKAVSRPLRIASLAIDTAKPVTSIGGTIYRDQYAMQILHQFTLLR